MSKRFANYHRNSRLEGIRQTGTCIAIRFYVEEHIEG